ncbi:putative integral membrane protein [Theileria parva strain Muguga]|uniref:Uncharacterized protein n=1 Tax=Theileria parva TaxID=5875 RepID=Q4N122_THEPA|nr:putative integral membrane protein [Theileria parva strain Muguga]EAN31536.1 putative integral membrane protein [Theileria parva strain Muguga]|eukprot:XP_763819.1 hypothetical protein [Theileria parva strain Muguga]
MKMYNNRNNFIYFIFIAVCINVCVSSRILDRSPNVCAILPKITNLLQKNSLLGVKTKGKESDLIILNNCSVSKFVKSKLNELGIDSSLLRKIEDENEKKNVTNSIINFINDVYKEKGYFNSSVQSYEYDESGKLVVECVEKSIPECNFRLFIKDSESNKVIEIKEENVIKSSLTTFPSGNYTQIPNNYLFKKIFKDKKMVKLDPIVFESIRHTGLYENLQYVIHRDRGEVYLDFFFDDYGIIHLTAPTLSLPPGGPVLNLIYRNINFFDTKSVFKLLAELNLLKILEYNHKFRLSLFSDVVDLSFWTSHCSSPTLLTLNLSFSKNDITSLLNFLRPFKQKLKSLIKDKIGLRNMRVGLKSHRKLDVKKLDEIREVTAASLEKMKFGEKEGNFKDFELSLGFLKLLGNFKYVLSTAFGTRNVTITNDLNYKLNTSYLEDPVLIKTTLMNKIKYKSDSPASEGGKGLNTPNLCYRVQSKVDVTLGSKCKMLFKYLYGNEMLNGDYRGLGHNKPKDAFFIAGHDFVIPITFRFKLIPYFGVFLDLIHSTGNAIKDLDLSFGLKLMVLNIAISVPLLTKLNSTFIFNNFSKENRRLFFSV